MNDFLNPKSMSTPGAAGALMMLIANALCNNFPEFPFRYIALILSFAIGAIVFSATTMKIWERGVYWVVNSLIIFAMGVGATNIAANNAAVQQALNEYPSSVLSAVMFTFAGNAFAEDGKSSFLNNSSASNQVSASTKAEGSKSISQAEIELRVRINAMDMEISKLRDENQRLQQSQSKGGAKLTTVEKSAEREGEGFFKRW